MNALLISQLAHDEIAERLRTAEREQLVRQARRNRQPSDQLGLLARAQRAIAGALTRPAGSGAVEPCPDCQPS